MVYAAPADAKANWRVHAAAVGFGELERLTAPLKTMRADAFFLLRYPRKDRADKWYSDRGVDLLAALRDDLKLETVGTWEVDLWDAPTVGNFLGTQIAKEGFTRLEVNVSTGPKTVGVGATLASLFWDLSLYYADLDYDKPTLSEVRGYRVQQIQRIPTFHHEPPRDEMIRTLEMLHKEKKPVTAADLKSRMTSEPDAVIRPGKSKRVREKMSPQSVHGQFQSILRPLVEQRLVSETRNFGRRYFQVTEQGSSTLRLLAKRP